MIIKEGRIEVNKIFEEVSNLKGEDKLIKISDFFLNTPYKKNSISLEAEKKRQITVDFEGVDCMTFLEYLEAFRLSPDFHSFITNLTMIRYFESNINFLNRRHFFSQWDTISTVENITQKIADYLCERKIKILNKKDQEKKWIESLPIMTREITYIPSSEIAKIIDKLKSVYYCGFFTSQQGLDVSHVGLLINRGKKIILRHASSLKGKVVDEDFIKYVRKRRGVIIYKPLFENG